MERAEIWYEEKNEKGISVLKIVEPEFSIP